MGRILHLRISSRPPSTTFQLRCCKWKATELRYSADTAQLSVEESKVFPVLLAQPREWERRPKKEYPRG